MKEGGKGVERKRESERESKRGRYFCVDNEAISTYRIYSIRSAPLSIY